MTRPALKSRKSLEPWIPDSLEYYWWQVDAVRDLCRRRSFLLADEMGLGKSLEALTVFAVDVKLEKGEIGLVVCPATLKQNWADEIEKFTRFPYAVLGQRDNGRGRMVSLSPAERVAQLADFTMQSGPRILIANYEQLKPHLIHLNNLGIHMAIFDEAHYVGNEKSQRSKASRAIRANRKAVLTGSPFLNQVDQLWPILNMIDPGRYSRYWPFVHRYGVFGGYQGKQLISVKNEAELARRVNEVMLRRLAKDCLKLDEPQIIVRTVGLSTKQRELYDEVVEDMKITVPGDPTPMDIQNALTKFLRLKQICGTTATVLGQDHDESEKLDLAIEDDMALIKQGEKIVVFTQFRGVMQAYERRILTAMGTAGIEAPVYQLHGDVPMGDRIPTVKYWSETKGPAIIVCMLQVAGVGLNMVAACHGSFLDKLFTPKMNEQAIARLNRLGQTRPVQIREYRVRGTVESRIEQILKAKRTTFNSVIEQGDFKKLLYLVMKAEEEDDL